MSFDGLIQEDIDLSDIYLAVGSKDLNVNKIDHGQPNKLSSHSTSVLVCLISNWMSNLGIQSKMEFNIGFN